MSHRERTTAAVSLALQQRAASTGVTPSATAERLFRDRAARHDRRRGVLLAAAAVVVVVALAVAGLVVGRGDQQGSPVPPAGPVERVTTRSLDPSAADATAHMAGDGVVVGNRLWFLRDDQLVITDLDGVQRSTESLPAGTDTELLCCLARAGGVVLVPTSTGYSHRDASTGQQLATTPSPVAGPVTVTDAGVWLRTSTDTVVLVEPGTNRVLRSLVTPSSADLFAASGNALFVASRETSDVRLIDLTTGRTRPAVQIRSTPGALAATESVVAVADEGGRLTVLDAVTGEVARRYRVNAASVGPTPRVVATGTDLWWSPDAGTVVRLSRDGILRDAVAVDLRRVWDNALQQRNGLYVTALGLWVPTRNDADDFEYHRLPLTLLQP